MKVRVIRSFAGRMGSYAEGQVFDLPDGVDWLEAGLVVPVIEEPETTESAAAKRSEKRVATRRKKVG